MFANALKSLERNMPMWAGIALAVTVALWGYGCSSKTDSLEGAGKATRDQIIAQAESWNATKSAEVQVETAGLVQQINALQSKIDMLSIGADAQAKAMQAKLDAAIADLDKQDELKAQIFAVAGTALQTVGGPVPAALASLLATGGFFLNGRRKDIIIGITKSERDAARASAAGVVS